MTIGIYSLYWGAQDLVYIGQSQNIEVRYKEHLALLKRFKHTNYKVQNAYNLYGTPTLKLLEECSIDRTNDAEIYWTKEFDALGTCNGLCIIEPGTVGWGTNSNSSKYSRIQILKVFSLLYKADTSVPEIMCRTGVSKAVINDILSRASHLWLSSSYPEQYSLMGLRLRKVSNISKKLGKAPIIVSPTGEQYAISSITEFCSAINIDNLCLSSKVRGFARIIDKTRKQYKGWKLLT